MENRNTRKAMSNGRILGIIIFISILSIVIYKFYTAIPVTKISPACTEEAKICPDGSTVGRTGPNCEFTPCHEGLSDRLTQEEAQLIAEKSCIKGGEALSGGVYNENSKTWWFEANLNSTPEGCHPACVVSEKTGLAEINWRCTGLVQPQTEEAASNIRIDNLIKDTVIKSPIKISGEAKNWYFEGSFPVKIINESGETLAQGIATAQSDWMVDDFVPFEAELVFDPQKSLKGEIIFEKDNPSGLPENEESFRLPVLFK